ncbi:response regulator [Fulvivirga sp. M361]|uniref:response regulator n=1 Tax=Fulvivirga sp. M361 TaxID=2594266 RepID=UPI00117B8486|nr:response regulator [Fulvivirga sp. M361]TRX60490.1 response regulator [Fulvivirga sp. M361]
MKALIVDDEKEICLLLSYQLEKLGIRSFKAHSLYEGLNMFNPDEHNIVFLDINLPDGNGLEIIPTLKAKNEHVKIVVISAYDTKSEHKKAFELGVFQFLGKPFSKKMIKEIIDSMDTDI